MRRFSASLAALLFLVSPAQAEAQAEERLQNADLGFGIYALGAKAFDVEMKVARGSDGLNVASAVRSTGAANLLLRFRMQSDLSVRQADDGLLSPLRYASQSDGSFSKRTIMILWGADGLPTSVVEPPAAADDRDPVLPEQTRGTFDPTTAVLARALRRDTAAPCEGSDRIFDGRRRYNLHYEAAGMERLEAHNRSAYAGLALKCRLRFEPIAGYSRKYMDQTRKLEDEVTEMWLARLPGQPVWLPVRLRSAWMLGEVNGHITAASINGRQTLIPVADDAPPPEPPKIAP